MSRRQSETNTIATYLTMSFNRREVDQIEYEKIAVSGINDPYCDTMSDPEHL
jgi:hypothetical protein